MSRNEDNGSDLKESPLASVLENSHLPNIVESLKNEGYAVLPSILTKKECEKSLDQIWEFVRDVSSGHVCRDDCSSWYPQNDKEDDNDPWPHTGYSFFPDMFQSHGAGYLLGHVREILAERVFEPLFGTKNLHASKEGFSFHRPPHPSTKNALKKVCGMIQSQSKGEHYDQGKDKYGLHTIQSSVAFIDQQVGVDGCFLCYPHSHSKIHQKIIKNKYRANFDWFPLTDNEINQLQNEFNLQPKYIYVNAGDVILWRSDLVHAASPPNFNTTNFRAVGYFSMLPTNFTKSYEDKLTSYKLTHTGDHNPHLENWHQHKRMHAIHLRPYFRFGPPKISWRLAQLYGLVPYEIENDEQQQIFLKKAIRRGVRFHDCKSLSILSPKRGIPCKAKVQIMEPSTGPILGQDKYLGGVSSPCGEYIYGVCGHAKQTLRIHCDSGKVDMIGPEYNGKFKWLRGVEIPSNAFESNASSIYPKGLCLALPCNAETILKINPHTQHVSTFGGPFKGGWKWHGGNLASNGMVYAIPADTNRVLKINPLTEETAFIGPDFTFMKQKWFGGIYAKTNGCIYGIPHNASGVLKINPYSDECTILGDGQLPEGEWKWHGGLSNLDGSKIYGFPNNAQEVLVINTLNDNVYTISSSKFQLSAGRHRHDNKYKYLGGALSADGKYAYLFPCDAERVLRIETKMDRLELIGPELLEGENKYQNGFVGKDGCIYGIPQRASSVIRIVPPTVKKINGQDIMEEEIVEMLYCGDGMHGMKDKFEGGVMGNKDGNIYCMPLRAKSVLRVILPENELSSSP